MRLRYFHIREYPPLDDIAVVFSADSFLEMECRIRFVVGVNGSGKTSLLQALTETFLYLERHKRPHFPVTLAYELGKDEARRALVFHCDGSDYAWWSSDTGAEFPGSDWTRDNWETLLADLHEGKTGWRNLTESGWPGAGDGLPRAVLAYTTGHKAPWEVLFREEPATTGVEIVSQSLDYDASNERPTGWNRAREIRHLQEEGLSDEAKDLQKRAEEAGMFDDGQHTCLFVTPTLLKFALLAVTLAPGLAALRACSTKAEEDAYLDNLRARQLDPPNSAARLLLEKIGWVWPVSVALDVDFRPREWSGTQIDGAIQPLYMGVTTVIREPEPGTRRRLHFDLKAPTDPQLVPEWAGEGARLSFGLADGLDLCGQTLLNFLGGADAPPFLIFQRLLDLHRQGLVADIQLAIRKTTPDDILLFDELSDGEQMFLGRVALIYLLQGQDDALLILDEPETHFNDAWKREIVAIIDNALRDTASDVLISTHSAIVLSDVFQDEIVLLERAASNGAPQVINLVSPTFGGDPGELMIRLFDTEASIGERAQRWLTAKLEELRNKPDARAELEDLIERIGPGAPRARLRTLLYRLDEQDASPDPAA